MSLRTSYLSCIFTLILLSPLQAQVIDKVVAVVNNEVITLSELNAETAEIKHKITETAPADQQEEAMAEAREGALNSIIDKKLIAQKAKEARVFVSDEEVEGTIAGIQKRASLSREQFIEELKKSGLSFNTYQNNIRSQLLQRKVINYDIRSKIVIPESQIREYYEKEYTINAQDGEYYLLQIGFDWDKEEAGSKEKTLQFAKRIHAIAVKGQDFGALAEKYSTLPSAKDRGDIGFFAIDDMSENMARAISPLKPGEVSNIIESPAGYQFFKVLSGDQNNSISKAPYATVKEVIQAKLFEIQMQKDFSSWVKELKENAYIQKL
ncbi:SurA N-terminal domain-containing protein [Desulfotalea psychrophila]|nr:SurA N-terminal domain-containing protein [Desulfotalea psychrophila]